MTDAELHNAAANMTWLAEGHIEWIDTGGSGYTEDGSLVGLATRGCDDGTAAVLTVMDESAALTPVEAAALGKALIAAAEATN